MLADFIISILRGASYGTSLFFNTTETLMFKGININAFVLTFYHNMEQIAMGIPSYIAFVYLSAKELAQ
jgi:hypothetical protein